MVKPRMFRWLRSPHDVPPREFYQAQQEPYAWAAGEGGKILNVPLEVLQDPLRHTDRDTV